MKIKELINFKWVSPIKPGNFHSKDDVLNEIEAHGPCFLEQYMVELSTNNNAAYLRLALLLKR